MSTCYVIQPFDNDVYDKRFDETISPAIKKAGLNPYRVDRDPSSTILFQDIENGINNASVCLADITEDNPNVWFELGFAKAMQKEIVMICSSERERRDKKFPFDIQHRSIIVYKTDTPSDFEKLSNDIIKKIKAASERNKETLSIKSMSITKDTEGLTPHEIAMLAIIMSASVTNPAGISGYNLDNMMEKAGYSSLATALSIRSLSKKGFIEDGQDTDDYGNLYKTYIMTTEGEDWVVDNQDKFRIKLETADLDEELGLEDEDPFKEDL
ncbi:MAG: hypothetical protein AB1546_10750 [bacterium]